MKKAVNKIIVLFMFVILSVTSTVGQDSVLIREPQIQKLFDSSGIVGMSAAIIIGNKVVWEKGYGFADLSTRKAFTPNTIMNIASITKTFTGVAIMKAVEEGKLSLDEDINTYLPFKVVNPNFPNEKITVRHLATHTSSLEDRYPFYDDVAYVYDGKNVEPLGQFLRNYFLPTGKYYAKENFLPNKPGTFRSYSNIGAGLAGYIVECVTKQSLQAYIKKNIFLPLGFKKSGWSLNDINIKEHTKLYDKEKGALQQIKLYESVTYPDGGVRTCVDELSRLFITLLNGGKYGKQTLLKKSSVDELTKFQYALSKIPTNVDSAKLNSGIFWATKMGGKTMGHNGTDRGVRTFMLTDLKKEIGVVIFFNTSLPSSDDGKYFDLFTALYRLGKQLKK